MISAIERPKSGQGVKKDRWGQVAIVDKVIREAFVALVTLE